MMRPAGHALRTTCTGSLVNLQTILIRWPEDFDYNQNYNSINKGLPFSFSGERIQAVTSALLAAFVPYTAYQSSHSILFCEDYDQSRDIHRPFLPARAPG